MDTSQPPVYTNQNIPPPPPLASAPSYGVFGTKIPSGVAFAVGILLFLLPFAEVKCNGNSIARNTGLGIVTGKEWKSTENLFGEEVGATTKTEGNQKTDPNAYAIIALALCVIGLALSMTNARAAIGSALLSGILSAASLIGLMIDLQRQAKDPNPMKGSIDGDVGKSLNDIKVTIEFTPWYYIAVVSFLAAAFFCYKRLQAKKR